MIKVLHSKLREQVKNNNVRELCSFSCSPYNNSAYENWGGLLVLNEVWINPNEGLPMQAHSNTEIVTVVLEGELTHLDTEGHKKILVPNEIQVMSSGKGVLHSEINSGTIPIHLYRLWFRPSENEVTPKYNSKVFNSKNWTTVVSPNDQHSLKINLDSRVYLGELKENEFKCYNGNVEKMYWLQVLEGQLSVNDKVLDCGDGAGIISESKINIKAISNCKLLLIEVNALKEFE